MLPSPSWAGLIGPETLTYREQVEILSDVLGRTIVFVDVTPEQLAQDGIQHGTPPADDI